MAELAHEVAGDLPEAVGPDQDDDDERAVCQDGGLVQLTVQAVPVALRRVTPLVTVTVGVVLPAVRVVDGITLVELRLAVEAVVQTLLAVTRLVTVAVLEHVVARNALRDRRAVLVQCHHVAAFFAIKLARKGVTFRLQKRKVNK